MCADNDTGLDHLLIKKPHYDFDTNRTTNPRLIVHYCHDHNVQITSENMPNDFGVLAISGSTSSPEETLEEMTLQNMDIAQYRTI
ncbi:29936_t:CDS:2 [Gigaspora margarita]|uniref:29936_t:CDS:1 n=1 Tax=Gigaspora margarita TaxID=4874 RepID=A0ABN7VK22_GIGMA|nr:29936_t:CDS:2 [Gigaspora margarita]